MKNIRNLAVAALVFAAGATLPSFAATNVTESVTLTEDTDWTEFGTVTVAEGATIDLNGHNLTVSDITGGGIVVDTTDQNVILAPDGIAYQKILYTQATQEGANNGGGLSKIQYVDTGYNHTGTTKVDIRVVFQDVSYSGNYGYAVFYGCRDLTDNTRRACQLGGWIHSGKFFYYDTAEHDGSAVKVNTMYDVRLDKGGASYANYEDGTRAANLGTGNGNGPNTWGTDYIFANNQVSNGGKFWPCRCQVYSCKVYEGDELKRDFVPVICASGANAGKAGFWCTVTERFYGNSGYGELTAGPALVPEGAGNGGSLTITTAGESPTSLVDVAPIHGNIKVVKAGAGTLAVPTAVYFTGGIDVQAGTLAIAGPVTTLEGRSLGSVAVASGAKVTLTAADGIRYGESFTLNGGTLEFACSGAEVPVTTFVTNSIALNSGAKIRFDTSALASTQFLLSADGFTLGTGVESAVSCAELSAPTETTAEAAGENGILVKVVTAPVTAVWTGGANNNSLSDPLNWSCTNILGGALSGAVPDEHTMKYILGADADWSAAAVTLANGVTLDLNGNSLTVADITGSGVVVDVANDLDHTIRSDANGVMYLEMEYLQTTGTYSGNSYNWGNQYIDTGYSHNRNTVVDLKVAITSTTSNWYCYYGSRKDWGATQIGGWIHTTSRWHYSYLSSTGSEQDLNGQNGKEKLQYTVDVPFLTHLECVGPCTIDGVLYNIANGDSSGTTDWLFAVNHAGLGIGSSYMAKAKMYYCVIREKDGDALVVKRNFRPAMRVLDGKPGMLDIENGVFYVNLRADGDFMVLPVKKSSSPAAGSLTIKVAAETTTSLADLAPICGNVKVVKAGEGTLAVPTTGVYFTGGIDVQEGTLALAGPVTSLEGANLGNVAVASGAKVALSGIDGVKYGEAFAINGGTLELVCAGTATPVTTYVTNSITLNDGAKIRFDTSAFQSTQFVLSTDGFLLGDGMESAVSCVELSAPTETIAEAQGANGIRVTVVTAPVTAVWTGAANNNDFNDPGNWSCTNIVGGALSGAIPDEHTATFALAADADWTAVGTLTLAGDVTLDLNGHSLSVAGIAGDGTVIDSGAQQSVLRGSDGTNYAVLEYLQSSATQYIDTGYRHNASTIVDMKVAITGSTTDWYAYYGSRTSEGNANELGGWIHRNVHWKGVAGAKGDTSWTFTQNVPFLVHLAAPVDAVCSLDGHTFTHPYTGTDSGQNDLLFAMKQGSSTVGWKAKAAIYYCTVREVETVMRDFVPVKRIPDGKPGMFDKANGVFYVNNGTGEFTPGPVSVPEGAGESGSLRFDVPEGETVTCNVLLVGDIKVVKDGAGTLEMAKASQMYFGGTEIAAGTMKPGTSGLALPCGMEGTTIFAAADGVIDFSGNTGMQKYVYDFADGAKALNGGAAISSGAFIFTSFHTPVSTGAFTASLSDGATLDLIEWDGEWPLSGVTAAAGMEESPTTVTLKVDMGSEKFKNLAKSRDAATGENNGYLLTFGGARTEYTAFELDPVSAKSYRLIEDENGDLILAFMPGTTFIIR